MLHPEFTAGVSAMDHAHGLWVKDIDLKEVAVHQVLKPVLVPSPLHFTQLHQISSLIVWVTLTVVPLIWHIAAVVLMTYSGRAI